MEFTVNLVALLMQLKGLTEVINVLTCVREAPKSSLRPIIGYVDRRMPFTPAFLSSYVLLISHEILLSCSVEVAVSHCVFK